MLLTVWIPSFFLCLFILSGLRGKQTSFLVWLLLSPGKWPIFLQQVRIAAGTGKCAHFTRLQRFPLFSANPRIAKKEPQVPYSPLPPSGIFIIFTLILIIFLDTLIKHPDKSHLREQGLVSAPPGDSLLWWGMSQHPESEAAGHGILSQEAGRQMPVQDPSPGNNVTHF